MRSGNPVLSERLFRGAFPAAGDYMTVDGAANKTLLLLLIALIGAWFSWSRMATGQLGLAGMLLIAGAGVGFVLGIVTSFKPAWAPVTAPIYALAEGLFLGGISARFQGFHAGIVFQAVLLTFGVALSMLAAYRARLVRASERFKHGLLAATGGICFLYLANLGLSLFGWHIPFIFAAGPIGIGFSLLVVGIAAFNLVLDFDFIEQAAAHGAPRAMEWYGAFALMVTLVWLYIEILNLLAKLNSNRD